MPFGLCNSPATFQQLMESLLSGLTQKICIVYIKDVLVINKNLTEDLEYLGKVFSQLRAVGLSLKLVKCTFSSSKVVYLGFVVSREDMSQDP